MWQEELLAAITDIDREQAPHGLYGMRHELSDDDRPIPFAKLFGGQIIKPNIPERLGSRTERAKWDMFTFSLSEDETVCIFVDTVATTKVRKFGKTYKVDRHHGKKPAKRDDEPHVSKKALARLGKSLFDIAAYLLVAHVNDEDEFLILLGEMAEPQFCERHGLSFHRREWADIHGRDLLSGLFLWSIAISSE